VKINPTFQHALACLSRPASLAAAGILLLNALVLQPLYPSWLSGKLGDAAWLVIVPMLISTVIALCLPGHIVQRNPLAGLAGVLFAGAAFTLVKISPEVNRFVTSLIIATLGFTPKLTQDPSDLLTLPALLIAWQTWQTAPTPHPAGRELPAARRLVALALMVLAVTADAPAPVNMGMTTLESDRNNLISCQHRLGRTYGGGNSSFDTIYRSTDGGLTWTTASASEMAKTPDPTAISKATPTPYQCPTSSVQNMIKLAVPTGKGDVSLLLIAGQGIYRSENEGSTLVREYKLKEESLLYGAVVHEASGNLVAAAGLDGLLVRSPSGDWKQIVPYNNDH
jgi:hypothetical protein